MIPFIAVIGEIFVKCYILRFLLINVPSRYTQLNTEIGGRQTRMLETGSFGIVSIRVVKILVGVDYHATGDFPQEEQLPAVS
jgi:hypothetical protein